MRLKIVMLLTLPVAVTAGYLAVQRAVVLPNGRVPLTWFDRVIPFQPRWVWVYLSLYLLNPIGPLFARSREDLLRYARGILFFFVCGFVCFVVFPVPGPRPLAADAFWLYQRLILIDRPYNSFPSLHAACAVYAVLFAAYASSDTSRPHLRRSLLSLAWLWVGLILYSTIATRQHFAIDLPAGMFLGWLAQWLFVSRNSRTSNMPAFVSGEAA
jgi:membrane-associated phospholipid phosphatase